MAPWGFSNAQPPLPQQCSSRCCPTSSSPESLGCRRVPLRQPGSRTGRHHHRASSAPLLPARDPPAAALGIPRCAQPACVPAAALGHGAWHPHAAAPTLTKGTSSRCWGAMASSEQGCTPKPSLVPEWAQAITCQAAGWYCQPHPLVTPAHLGAHLVDSASIWTMASPLQAPYVPGTDRNASG